MPRETLFSLSNMGYAEFVFVCFETGSYYVVLAGLELAVWSRLALNSEVWQPLSPK